MKWYVCFILARKESSLDCSGVKKKDNYPNIQAIILFFINIPCQYLVSLRTFLKGCPNCFLLTIYYHEEIHSIINL